MITALPRLHAVTDDRVAAAGSIAERAEAMARAAGPALAVHVRARLEGAAFLELARAVGAAIAAHGSWLVINGRADVARALGARALVSGRGGLSVADARRVAPRALVGRSVHDDAEARGAIGEGADFLIASTGWESASHADGRRETEDGSEQPGRLPSFVSRLPSIAIGGITPERTPELLAAGAWGVAAIRALWDAPDPAAAAAAFVAQLPRDDTVAVVINGEARRARTGISLAALLADLGLDPRAVVVEHNRDIVRREALDRATVAEGDQIELVHFVGGG